MTRIVCPSAPLRQEPDSGGQRPLFALRNITLGDQVLRNRKQHYNTEDFLSTPVQDPFPVRKRPEKVSRAAWLWRVLLCLLGDSGENYGWEDEKS